MNEPIQTPVAETDRGKKKDATLENSLSDAEVLATYAIWNNLQGVQEAVQGVAEARESFKQGKLMGEAQKVFYTNFSKLAARVAPVTVSTIKSCLEEYGIKRRTWFGLGPEVQYSLAQSAAIRYRRWGMVALICLLIVQSYWLVGSNLLNALPKYSDAQKAALLMESINRISVAPSTVPATDQDAAGPIASQPTPAPLPEGKDREEKLTRASAIALGEETQRLADMLATWCRVLVPFWIPDRDKIEQDLDAEIATINSSKDMKDVASAQIRAKSLGNTLENLTPDRVIALASRVLEVLQQYVLPLLYGWLGAMAYILRTLGEQARARTYSVESRTDFNLRVWLGIVAGLAIGWFFRADKDQGPAIGSISALALAFVAGYSVDLLFTAMDRIVAAFSPARDGSVKAIPAVSAKGRFRESHSGRKAD